MALFKSQIVTQASGSIGGVTFTRTRSGMTLRARAMPTNPNTPYQQAVRANQSVLAQAWQSTLTDLQREAWDNYAAAVARKNKLGDTIHLTGNTMFVRCNAPRLQAGMQAVYDGPIEFTLGDPVTALMGVTSAGTPNTLQVTWDDINLPTNTQVLVYVSRPMSPTRNFFKGPFRFNKRFASGSAGGALDPDLLPQPIGEGNKVVIRVRVAYPDGRLSDAVTAPVIADVPIPGTSE